VNLVDQTSAVLSDYGVEHGVIQAGTGAGGPTSGCRFARADPGEARLPREGRTSSSSTRRTASGSRPRSSSRTASILKVIGLTATPFTKGLKELYTNIVNVTTTDKLVAEGHLVPLKMYAAKAIDMAGREGRGRVSGPSATSKSAA
jgi:DNA repair protein RadD